jgi:hypothetical protein
MQGGPNESHACFKPAASISEVHLEHYLRKLVTKDGKHTDN